MNKLPFLSLIILTFFITTISKAQTIPAPTNIEVYMQKAETDTTNLYADTLFKANTNQIGKMVIVLEDTFNISKIYVNIKSSANSTTTLFTKTFIYSQSGNFSDGTSLNRVQNVLYIGLGSFMGLNTWYGESKLESPTGYQTQTVIYDNTN